MMSWDLNTHLRTGDPIVPYDRNHAVNPIISCYQDAKGRWFWLLMLQGDRHWPDFLRAIAAPELGEDPRFVNLMARAMNATALVEELDRILATKTIAEWGPIFDRENVWWAPVNTIEQVISDPAVREAGAFVEVPSPDGPVTQVAAPAEFYGTPGRPRAWVPELGQHTEEVLLELGMDWDGIIALKEVGAIL
jgi:crotonobetainyl-CoA:carnitine CoA-transferase CaiB-like acyl-CoA transferase